MSAQHTPGPWHIGKYDEVMDADDRAIRVQGMVLTSSEVALANARLIAAAPELLAALQMAVLQNDYDMLMTGEELRQCASAIAKATGSAA